MLQFTSSLKAEYEKPLEELLFFNPGQKHAYAAIVDSLEQMRVDLKMTEYARLVVLVRDENETCDNRLNYW